MAAGYAGLRDPLDHEALGETARVHPGHVPCPEQFATSEVVLEREGPCALLAALGGNAVALLYCSFFVMHCCLLFSIAGQRVLVP